MTEQHLQRNHPAHGAPIKAWTRGVPLEDAARNQLLNVAQLPFIYKWVAAIADVHWASLATRRHLNVVCIRVVVWKMQVPRASSASPADGSE